MVTPKVEKAFHIHKCIYIFHCKIIVYADMFFTLTYLPNTVTWIDRIVIELTNWKLWLRVSLFNFSNTRSVPKYIWIESYLHQSATRQLHPRSKQMQHHFETRLETALIVQFILLNMNNDLTWHTYVACPSYMYSTYILTVFGLHWEITCM